MLFIEMYICRAYKYIFTYIFHHYISFETTAHTTLCIYVLFIYFNCYKELILDDKV